MDFAKDSMSKKNVMVWIKSPVKAWRDEKKFKSYWIMRLLGNGNCPNKT